ncbi:hypothetical protein HPB50_023991 [Hyalomma asiaticum]|uniref:Uncharacterized protein n=1 Tax=Hyalomma asiaticum TaxID=266040 RepID=A0ACB7SBQ9_HYAAI|nr:hypothetical protein HPB50_023991 [Hyalomma asiaticum]
MVIRCRGSAEAGSCRSPCDCEKLAFGSALPRISVAILGAAFRVYARCRPVPAVGHQFSDRRSQPGALELFARVDIALEAYSEGSLRGIGCCCCCFRVLCRGAMHKRRGRDRRPWRAPGSVSSHRHGYCTQ